MARGENLGVRVGEDNSVVGERAGDGDD